MALLNKHLYTKKSTIPGAGKGLFTKVFIPKGIRITEYKGRILTWKQVENMPDESYGYVFWFNKNYVIDAWKTKKGIAHYSNDANGLTKVPGIKNNCEYDTEKKRCYLKSACDIAPGMEILVPYGGDYWRVIRYNIRVDEKEKEKAGKNGKTVLPHHLAAKRQAKKHVEKSV